MKNDPCDRVAALPFVKPMPEELAYGIELTLESTRRDLEQIQSILGEAIEAIVAEFGADILATEAHALRLQALSQELLASAVRRIDSVRAALDTTGDGVA